MVCHPSYACFRRPDARPTDEGVTDYYGMTAKVTKRAAHGLLLLGSYTWQKVLALRASNQTISTISAGARRCLMKLTIRWASPILSSLSVQFSLRFAGWTWQTLRQFWSCSVGLGRVDSGRHNNL